jgi:hypothetical protein
MRSLIIITVLSCGWCVAKAQDQFTNSGNFHVLSGASVTFFGNFANNGTFTDNGVAVSFHGNAGQIISGSSVTTLRNLVIDASTSTVSLQQNLTISNSVALTSGALDLNSLLLTINNNAGTALSRTTGYIVSEQTNNASRMRWNIGTNTRAHVFPFGTAAGSYIPVTVTVSAGDIGNVTLSTYPTAANNTPFPTTPNAVTNVDRFGADNSANVVDRFWQIDKDGPSGTATLILSATAAEVGTITSLQAQRWNTGTSAWDTPLAGQSGTATTVTVPGVTSFSPWTISGNNLILPVELLSFTARPAGNSVDLNWKTATEIDNDYFTVQRSRDGVHFIDVGKVAGAGTTQKVQKYNFLDRNVSSGRHYYRLKQTDYDGAFKFSAIERVDIESESESQFLIYPNPVANTFAFKAITQYKIQTVTVINAQGVSIGAIELTSIDGMHTGEFDLSNHPVGFYILKAVHDHGAAHVKIIKE